jgi:hypothetical protein
MLLVMSLLVMKVSLLDIYTFLVTEEIKKIT